MSKYDSSEKIVQVIDDILVKNGRLSYLPVIKRLTEEFENMTQEVIQEERERCIGIIKLYQERTEPYGEDYRFPPMLQSITKMMIYMFETIQENINSGKTASQINAENEEQFRDQSEVNP